MANLPAEQSVFGVDAQPPPPVDENDVTVEAYDNPPESFNHANRITQNVTITGEIVVFQEGHPTNLLHAHYHESQAIKNMEINAKKVIFRSPLHFALKQT